MAFTFQVIRGSTTYTLSGDGQPIRLEDAQDLGGASVRNIEESGPYQDGATHLDERLEPGTFNLRFIVQGTSASALDGHRDTLNTIFKPVKGVPITLKITRDDGTIRHFDTRRTGRLSIPLVPMNRPGNLHRAVVQLRAADPLWYDPVAVEEGFDLGADSWWLAGGAIGSANVLTHVEYPAQGQAWTLSSNVTAGSPWTIVFRSGFANYLSNTYIAFNMTDGPTEVRFQALQGNTYRMTAGGGTISGTTLMAAGEHNYFAVHNGGTLNFYRGTVPLGTAVATSTQLVNGPLSEWSSDVAPWPVDLPFAAVYNIALGTAQISALNSIMSQGTALVSSITYEGDYDSYPVITITGPMTNPVITNETTGDTLDFTGSTVSPGSVWVIDTRYGRKSASSGTTSVLNHLSLDSDLSTFRIVSAPLASGGTNQISISGTAFGGSTSVAISYYNRYMSY